MSNPSDTAVDAALESAFVCEAGCETFSDECPFCVLERLTDTDTSSSGPDSDAVHAALNDSIAGGNFDPELRELPGSIGVTFQGATRSRRKPQWVAQFWSSRLGFPFPVTVGAYPTKDAAAESYDKACLAMGLPARNYPRRAHSEAAIASVRAHLESHRKPA